MVSRLNDAILLTREMVKQRWSPMAILSMARAGTRISISRPSASWATDR